MSRGSRKARLSYMRIQILPPAAADDVLSESWLLSRTLQVAGRAITASGRAESRFEIPARVESLASGVYFLRAEFESEEGEIQARVTRVTILSQGMR